MTTKFRKSIAVALACAASSALYTESVKSGISPVVSIVSTSVMMSLCMIVFEKVMRLPMLISLYRKLTHPGYKFEGHWIQTVDYKNQRFYTVVRVEYQFDRDIYDVIALTYTDKGEEYSRWHTKDVQFGKDRTQMSYDYSSKILMNSSGVHNQIYGEGEMVLSPNPLKLRASGLGYFMEKGNESQPINFTFEKFFVPESYDIGNTCAYHIGMRDYIRAYHNWELNKTDSDDLPVAS